MIATRLLRAAEATLSPTKARFNPYKAQKPWPPDFSKLDPKYQFRLERRYRRRTKLKWTRPRWVKGVKLAQWGICGSVFVYGILFMDWGTNDNIFKDVREWFNIQSSSVWTTRPGPSFDPVSDATKTNRSPGESRSRT